MAERLAEFNALLARLKRNDPTLVELNLVSYGLVPETVEPIAEALKTNKSLKILNLSRNRIRDQGATALSFALRINDTLESLDVSWNEIGAPGAVSIADTLLVNQTLLDLNIEVRPLILHVGPMPHPEFFSLFFSVFRN
jgi:Ran GTPase-activating protein (RanGAP) involved in mRNA processing and transport